MNILKIDLETYSEFNLKKYGVFGYVEHPSTEIMVFVYRWNNEKIYVWDLTEYSKMPENLKKYIQEADYYLAHNSAFDRNILERFYPKLFVGKLRKWLDTMVLAYLHSLQGSLAFLSKAFKLEEKGKIAAGKNYIQLFCKPLAKNRKLKRATRLTHPKDWADFLKYARNDVIAMSELFKKLPRWNLNKMLMERWYFDQEMASEGMYVDVELAEIWVKLLQDRKEELNALIKKKTKDSVKAATQQKVLLQYINERFGVEAPNLTKTTLKRLYEADDTPEPLKEIIEIRTQSASTSGVKWETLLNVKNSDDRLRGCLQPFRAMRTLRDAGQFFQPQNMPRPKYKQDFINAGIEAVKAGFLDLFIPDDEIINFQGSCLRGVIIAPDGQKFCVADLSAIECRGTAFVGREEEKLETFRKYDKFGGYDVYQKTCAAVFGFDPKEVKGDIRQWGKVLELAFGYRGGPGALINMCNTYRIDFSDMMNKAYDYIDEGAYLEAKKFYPKAVEWGRDCGLNEFEFSVADGIKRIWREKNSSTAQHWKNIETAIVKAWNHPGKEYQADRLWIDRRKNWIRMLLPTGRYLSYPKFRIERNGNKYSFFYEGRNTYTHKWEEIQSHGGKFTENEVQAISGDQLFYGIIRAYKERNYKTILRVHDEAVAQVPDTLDYSVDELIRYMCSPAPGLEELPLAAEGKEIYRYGKI